MDDLIGYISSSEAGITCETPSFTSEKTFEIQGYSKADAVVKIFIDEKLQGEVKTDHKGFISTLFTIISTLLAVIQLK